MKRLLAIWLLTAISLLAVSFVIPGFRVDGLQAALIAALVIGLLNATIGLVLKVLTIPLTIVTFGLFYLVLNALLIMAAARLVAGFAVSGFWSAFFGSIVLSIVNSVLEKIFLKEKG